MKHHPHIINIPTPCHEGWDNMTPTEKGRHCAACQKTVVDFTLMSDGQIIDIFSNNKGNTICGHFLETQLSRELTGNGQKTSFADMLAKRVAAMLLLLQGMFTTATAQLAKKQTQVIETARDPQKPAAKPAIKTDRKTTTVKKPDIPNTRTVDGEALYDTEDMPERSKPADSRQQHRNSPGRPTGK